MEKQVEKKQDVKDTAKAVESNVYVKLSDMEAKDILALPRYNGNLVKTKTRRGQIQYKIIIQLDPLLKIERYISETEFNLVVLERNLRFELPIQHLIIPGRLIAGTSVNNRDWKRYEFFVSKNLVLTNFFAQHEVALIYAAKLQLEFIKSDEKYDDELITVFNEEDFI